MPLLPYFTLAQTAHRLAVGARPLGEGPIVELDADTYAEELALKEELLQALHAYYFQAGPGTEAAQWEALALILDDLQRSHPTLFSLVQSGDVCTWRNELTGCVTSFCSGDARTLPCAPLDWVGREVQEDLLLLEGEDPFPLVAGQLCFPNRWSLDEKMGQSFLEIHGPVPGFMAEIGRASSLLLARLKPLRPVWRYNWSLTIGGELDFSTRLYDQLQARVAEVTAANCGELCYMRAERQTLTRLPQTGAILFTVHTYRTPVGVMAADPLWVQRFGEILEEATPEFLAYKGVTPVLGSLRAYLQTAPAASIRDQPRE
jgi:hypothetical protein